jgi:hypothetical protein
MKDEANQKTCGHYYYYDYSCSVTLDYHGHFLTRIADAVTSQARH